ncbi:non-ribosomal peptide synthetase [Streptomyces sp. NPDC000070]|uniref:non-ribosomal peptide synthetase n=1 Tax=Streptomyces sp. NPDC000070 TaxID=3154240 RepID=UPI003321EC66
MSNGLGERTPSRTVHAAFERCAAAFPHAPAVSVQGTELSYAELDARANQLAHHLGGLGVSSEDPIALHLERSVDLFVGLLAVLKAGCSYLALDRRAPQEWQGRLLQTAGAKLVLTLSEDAERIPGVATPVPLDQLATHLSGLPTAKPATTVGLENTAYIAFTSGSTGTPKGVCVPHRAVLRLVLGADFLSVGPDDTVLQYAPLAFDASTLEVWAPLLNGGRLAVAPPGELTPGELVGFVRDEAVTVAWFTAGLFHQVVDTAPEALGRLRHLLAGGDVLSAPHVRKAAELLPAGALINGYGPTENTTFTCCHPVGLPLERETVPIGRPIRGTTAYVLDEHMRPVPSGEVGELHTGGLGLARGYVNDPDQTAERFIPDPFADSPGARMYRTGDLVRELPDGSMEFVGRVDAQVKIRGFRVEPGETEAALRRHPDVKAAAVVAQTTKDGVRLAAFYVSDLLVSAPALRRALSEELAPYFVPTVFTRLESLPLTANGKVDRKSLSALTSRQRPDVDSGFRPPGTPVEKMLAQLWADVMELDEVGVDDDFFELGGHSLIATQITAEIGNAFDAVILPRTFYENPTVAELAERIEELIGGDER